MYLIVGLGNPGSRYKNTRHNIGFKVIDLLSRELGVRLTKRRFRSENTLTRFSTKPVVLLCSLAFMNQTGTSVRACADYYNLESRDILVIHDDLDLPVGRVKATRNGGSGGHKGVASIIDHLGDTRFPRIKIGIGRPRYGEDVEAFVLSPFYHDEKDTMERISEMAVHTCGLFISDGIESAMRHINCENLISKEVKN